MTRHRLSSDQQLGADILTDINVLIRCQQRSRGVVTAADGDEITHKPFPAFGQVSAPVRNGGGQPFTVTAVHRRAVTAAVIQTQIIHLTGKLVQAQDRAVKIDLTDGGECRNVITQCGAHIQQTRIIHFGETGIGIFQQYHRGDHILVIPQFALCHFDQEIRLSQQPAFHIGTGQRGDTAAQ